MLSDREEIWVKKQVMAEQRKTSAASVGYGGLRVTIHCPVCHKPMKDPHEAPSVEAVAGTTLWLECTHCPRQMEVELKFVTRWIGDKKAVHVENCATRSFSGRPNKCNCGVSP